MNTKIVMSATQSTVVAQHIPMAHPEFFTHGADSEASYILCLKLRTVLQNYIVSATIQQTALFAAAFICMQI